MPPAHHPDDHPDDTHGGNAIHDNDQPVEHDASCRHEFDLHAVLDCHAVALNDDSKWPDFWTVLDRAEPDVAESFRRVLSAINLTNALPAALARLSPEERAEFDRRTT